MIYRTIPPQLYLPKTKFKIIRNGSSGIVFRISSELAGKILFEGDIFKDTTNYRIRSDDDAETSLSKEAEINFQLYAQGFPVPKPTGVERINIFENVYPALIMQYLPYPTGSELGYHEFETALDLVRYEVDKSMDNGFIPGKDWDNPNNFMYNRKLKKIYLIDFGRWSLSEKINF